MNLSACMKKNVISISPQATAQEAAEMFVKYHIGTLPVVNSDGTLAGILQIRDLISLVMPDFVNMMQDIDFVLDFGAAEMRVPDAALLSRPVSEIMQPPISGKSDCSLLRSAAVIKKHNLSDLPVVDEEDHLIGIASLVDIGTRFLHNWH